MTLHMSHIRHARLLSARRTPRRPPVMACLTLLAAMVGNGCRPSPPEQPQTLPQSQVAIPSEQQPTLPQGPTSAWESPTHGPSLQLKYLPSGLPCILVWRAAEFAAMEGSSLMLRAMGQDFQRLLDRWKTDTGVPIEMVDQMVVGLVPDDLKHPRSVIVARLREPWVHPEWWKAETPQTSGSQTYRSHQGWCYFEPPDEQGKVLVLAHRQEIMEVLESSGGPPLLIPPMQKLLRSADATRLFNVLCVPNFLYADGRDLFEPDRGLLRDQMHWCLGDDMQALAFSMHWDAYWHVELLLVPRLGRTPGDVAQTLRQKLKQIPDRVEGYLSRIPMLPYWQRLAIRYPSMVRFVCDFARIQAHAKQVQANVVLPRDATHNLFLATDLAVRASSFGPPVDAPTSTAPAVANLEQLLERPVSFGFGQLSLENALQELQAHVVQRSGPFSFPFEIVVVGEDLRTEGITRNQQIREFRAERRSLQEVLTELMMRANPVTSVTAPDQPDQKLVWYLEKPRGQVRISVRSVCEERGIVLPADFLPGN